MFHSVELILFGRPPAAASFPRAEWPRVPLKFSSGQPPWVQGDHDSEKLGLMHGMWGINPRHSSSLTRRLGKNPWFATQKWRDWSRRSQPFERIYGRPFPLSGSNSGRAMYWYALASHHLDLILSFASRNNSVAFITQPITRNCE